MKTCALVIGHKKNSPGASNAASGLTEFDYNDRLAMDIEKEVQGVALQRVYRRTYRSLPDDINELAPDFVISLHCNAFNKEVSGSETLYYHRSLIGEKMARILQKQIVRVLKLKDRGIVSRTAEDRGGYLLSYTKAPCVIVEPFFIDNDEDLRLAQKKHSRLVSAYAKAIQEIAKLL